MLSGSPSNKYLAKNSREEDDQNIKYQRYEVELGHSIHPNEILSKLRQYHPITLKFLDGQDTCSEFVEGKTLGQGKSGTVFEIDEKEHKGLPVVLKEFKIKESTTIKDVLGKKLFLMSSSLTEVIMSSIFHSFYDGGWTYSISFPYFEGFFACKPYGYSIVEKLENTLARYIDGPRFNSKSFKVIVFQSLYAIKFMVKRQIVHNDMHAKNIMTRSTNGISYRGAALDDFRYFSYTDGNNVYTHENTGIIAKIVDFDFSCKYSDPMVCPTKVYNKQQDDWNLQFRFSTSYDFLTFIAYLVYYTIIRKPGDSRLSNKEIDETRKIVRKLAEYVVKVAEHKIGEIDYLGHFSDKMGRPDSKRNAISKLMDMVSTPQYRPYEKYSHLDLDGILNIDLFDEYKTQNGNSLMVGMM